MPTFKIPLGIYSALVTFAWGSGALLIAEATTPGGDYLSPPSWIKAGVMLGVLTGAFYAIARKAVGFGVDRVIQSWESLEANQGQMHQVLSKLAEDFRVHTAIEQEWQRGMELRVRMLEGRRES